MLLGAGSAALRVARIATGGAALPAWMIGSGTSPETMAAGSPLG